MNLEDILASPDFLPLKVNFDSGIMSFSRVTRQDYLDPHFLDMTMKKRTMYDVTVKQLGGFAVLKVPPPKKPVSFIFHGAFCCSTLLARYLDQCPNVLTVKEPFLLTQAAMSMPEKTRPIMRTEWDAFLRCTLGLLSRTYSDEERPVIKGNDLCNQTAEAMMEACPDSRALFVVSEIRDFMLLCLRNGLRRKWLRTRLVGVAGRAVPGLKTPTFTSLTDTQGAA